MGIKVLVNSTPRDRISINTQTRSTVRTVGIGNIPKLSSLIDVDTSDPDDNETLVYDAASEKYVVKTLPVVNGGTF
jgi:hypothetical protein